MVSVLYENGEHGAWAGPIARDVIKAHFDKKARQEWTQRQKPVPPERRQPRPSAKR